MATPTPVLAIKNLETWYGPVNAIKGVNLEVQPGRIVAVLGANGAGKTTLLNTIAGVIDPFKGSINYKGQAIHGQDPDQVARNGVVLVPEGRQVFPFLSVRENLMMGTFARAGREHVEADLARIFTWFPRLLERQTQHGGLLSGGEQQMLAIGRALMARPAVLLLDEPSLGLSPLATADDGYIMELGRIVAAGSCAELMAKDDVKEFYLGGGHQQAREDGQKQRWKRRKTWR
ncbi:MAG: ABC transporter ATP-binding protein [Betaproteobacteria bacterium]|nr:ABC transporter ATP-binding protein [Betaproteobacteria bacterium]